MKGNAYIVAGNVTAGTNKTAVHLIPGSVAPIFIYRVIIGSQSTPAAQAGRWVLVRTTADGTGTAVTPAQINGTGAASRVGATVNHSIEPAYGVFQTGISLALNQQATMDWQANPGKEVEVPPSATAGIGLKFAESTGTALHSGTVMWEE